MLKDYAFIEQFLRPVESWETAMQRDQGNTPEA